MKKFFLLSLFYIASIYSGIAQTPTIVKDEIVWTSTLNRKEYFKNIEYLSFSQFYFHKDYKLPEGQSATSYRIKLKNYQFIALTESEISTFADLPMPDSLKFNSKILYDNGKPVLKLQIFPFVTDHGKKVKLSKFEFEVSLDNKSKKGETGGWITNSALSTGKWYKIKLQTDGIYKLTSEDIKKMGFANLANIRIFGSGGGLLPTLNSELYPDDLQEIKLSFSNSELIFYAEGPLKWKYNKDMQTFVHQEHYYSDYSYYFVTEGVSQNTNLVQNSPEITTQPAKEINSFADFQVHERNDTNIIESGRVMYGEQFGNQSTWSFSFNFPNLIENQKFTARTSLIHRSTETAEMTLRYGTATQNFTLPKQTTQDYLAPQAIESEEINSFITVNGENVNLALSYAKPTSTATAWLDFLEVKAVRKLSLKNINSLLFNYFEPENIGKTVKMTISEVSASCTVWNVTDFNHVSAIPASLNNGNLSFLLNSTDTPEKIAIFNAGALQKPILEGKNTGLVANQNLHNAPTPDYLIISHSSFIDEANRLANFHQKQNGLNCLVATNEQIYNEFSSGSPDVAAIRNFARMFYDRGEKKLKYLLLFGDGSYNNKKEAGNQNTNYVLTYQSDVSLDPIGSFTTDDFFAMLDPGEGDADGFLDIGVGRLPVQTQTQAAQMVDKIIHYHQASTFSNWRNYITYIADDEDYNLHIKDANSLAEFVKTMYQPADIEKIYLDAFPQISTSDGPRYPEVNKSIKEKIEKGTAILNYTGHANEDGLALEAILRKNEILDWQNFDKLSIFLTATCEFSRYDNPKKTSAGELCLLTPKGGAIAMFSTTRVVYADQNFNLNSAFYNYLFSKNEDGNPIRLGDLMRLTKNAAGTGNNKRNFTLLGDPAIRVPFPSNTVTTSKINDKDASTFTDTLHAFDKVRLEGEIRDKNKSILTNFNGKVWVTVFDKPSTLTTLNNDKQGAFTYQSQTNIIYKGISEAKAGKFSAEFILPRDINLIPGAGKISYYAADSLTDANGAYSKLMIGKIDQAAETDTIGPEINMYLADTNFVSGGITNQNPIFVAKVWDKSGINTSSTNIGHDISLVIDGDINNTLSLNDAYTSDNGSFQSGLISYQLSNLKAGKHTLKLKVWDVYNNSSETSIEFIVIKDESFEIQHIVNYPNPFRESTDFYISQNQSGQSVEVKIAIYTLTGSLIKTIEQKFENPGFNLGPVHWNGEAENSEKVRQGLYIYKVELITEDGKKVAKAGKLSIF
jgi:hypothetical protein